MASTLRPLNATQLLRAAGRNTCSTALPLRTSTSRTRALRFLTCRPRSFSVPVMLDQQCAIHSSARRHKRAHNNEEIPEEPPTTDFSRMDVLGQVAAPSTSVDVCMSDGFKLNNGTITTGGRGLILVGGESFSWQPWGPDKKLVNAKGQWQVPNEAFGLLSLLWPRPDLLILGLGPVIRPLNPETSRHISSLGLRVEILDTRNAAAQYNMLATERGVDDVAAALIPIGWREGVGAKD